MEDLVRLLARAIVLQQVELNTLVATMASAGRPLTGEVVSIDRKAQLFSAAKHPEAIETGSIDHIAESIREIFPAGLSRP